jgi:cyclic pyranopterin phosphate synthase
MMPMGESNPDLLTHVDGKGQPTMVDVSAKMHTTRQATAVARITLPGDCALFYEDQETYGKKGPILSTAIVAGTLAAKKTSDWIPFCHPIGIDSCTFSSRAPSPNVLELSCTVKTRGPTGVEMEALVGVSAAALVVFDMCKAISSNIVIGPIEVVEKRGGKRDFSRASSAEAPMYGLVLAGGRSMRMGQDKALLRYVKGCSQLQACHDLLTRYCQKVFVSARSEQQALQDEYGKFPCIIDSFLDAGPLGGILSAQRQHPGVAFLVVAIDLPGLDDPTIGALLKERSPQHDATAFLAKSGEFLEPLCTIYEPKSFSSLLNLFGEGLKCPSKMLGRMQVHAVHQEFSGDPLQNINTPAELQAFQSSLRGSL